MRESVVLTKRQQHEVGHEGVITGRDGFSLRSPMGSLQSTYPHDIRFNRMSSNF
ncbi:hypothetical protein [Lysinibacillus sp. NPDC096212]|uniref:hypothetical protein n=1 Tax=Lysinibacillus sp. NPDC096212 TaxID=3364135 RepID=UPI003823E94E